jgi:plasmid stabilization system protein ParE
VAARDRLSVPGPAPPALVISPRAVQEIDEARTFWIENRDVRVLDAALAGALRFIEAFPEAPPLVQTRGAWVHRRMAVEPVGYNLFYRYDPRTRVVLVKCFRHQSRRRPRL